MTSHPVGRERKQDSGRDGSGWRVRLVGGAAAGNTARAGKLAHHRHQNSTSVGAGMK